MNSHRFFIITKIALAAIILAGFAVINMRLIDPDLGWHLKTGEEILQTHALPAPDHFSNTAPGTPWVDHEWVIEALWAWFLLHNAWWVVVALFTLLAFCPFLLWFVRARSFASLWLVFISAASVTPFIGIRAQIISFALFFLAFELFHRFFITERKKKYLWWFVPIMFVWTNLHAGFFIGLALLGIFIAGDAIALYLKEKRVSLKQAFFPGVIFLSGFAVTFLNPYTWRYYKFIVENLGSSDIMHYISEFQPIYGYFNSSIIALTGIALILGMRFYKTYPFPVLFVAAVFLAFSFKSARNWPLFIITAQPFLSGGIAYLSQEIREAHKRKPFLPKTVSRLRIASIGMFVVVISFFSYKIITYTGVPMPEQASVFLQEQYTKDALRKTVLFNSYEWGGWLIQNVPDLKVFIDGRMPYWKTSAGRPLLGDYLTFFKNDGKEREELLDRYGITMIMLRRVPPRNSDDDFWKTHIPQSMQESMRTMFLFKKIHTWTADEPVEDIEQWLPEHGWNLVYQDGLTVIFVK